jgi:phosphatidylserine decarboxylase
MKSTKESPFKHIADTFGINARFHKKEDHNNIDPSLEYVSSPAEATLFYHGKIDREGYILSKHKKRIELEKLIGKYADTFQDGIYLNMYLSPKNKHYFIFPYDGNVEYIQKNESKAFIPVMIGLDNIFGNQRWFSKAAERNASVGMVIDAKKFSYAMIAVGSLNVNHITVKCETGKKYHKGDYAGHFSVGSTILLCFDKSFKENSKLLIKNGDKKGIGDKIIKINSIYEK